jgi:hypothetical protein
MERKKNFAAITFIARTENMLTKGRAREREKNKKQNHEKRFSQLRKKRERDSKEVARREKAIKSSTR